MRRIAWSDRVTQPWKNGGGVTHELLREGDGACGFALRLSIAEVAADGPFSRFPGVDRVILMLEGRGFRLTGPQQVAITELAAPFAFAGEDAWDCALVDGPVRDFNVMVDRAALRAEVVAAAGAMDLGPRGFVLALAPCRVAGIALDRWDLGEGAGPVVLASPAVVVRVAPAAARE